MAAGSILLDVKDGDGVIRTVKFWSSDGTAAGTLQAMGYIASGDAVVGLAAGSAIIGKVGIDQTTPGTTNGVQANASEAHIGQTTPAGFVVNGAAFTRPANTTAYASGQLVANSTTAGSVVPVALTVARINAGTGRIVAIKLFKSTTSLTNAQFRVHFYKSAPTFANGDGGNWSTTGYVAGVPIYLGSCDVVINKALSDGSVGEGYATIGPILGFTAGAGVQTIQACIEARAAYTPGNAETFVISVTGDQD